MDDAVWTTETVRMIRLVRLARLARLASTFLPPFQPVSSADRRACGTRRSMRSDGIGAAAGALWCCSNPPNLSTRRPMELSVHLGSLACCVASLSALSRSLPEAPPGCGDRVDRSSGDPGRCRCGVVRGCESWRHPVHSHRSGQTVPASNASSKPDR